MCVYSLLSLWVYTGGLSTYHLILKKPTTRCQGGFISFFFKDDKCIDINIFLVPMATIFKRGMELAFLLPHVVLFILDISNLLCALALG